MCEQDRSFGPYTIRGNEIFVETPLSFAFVNLKPVVPGAACWVQHTIIFSGWPCRGQNVCCSAGHVLVSSKRVEPRYVHLSDEEAADLW